MIRLIAEYQVKEGTEQEVLSVIREFVATVHREEPYTEYRAFRLGDSRDFLHIMAFPDEAAQKKHQEADYTRRFAEVLYPNCEEEPKFTPVTAIER